MVSLKQTYGQKEEQKIAEVPDDVEEAYEPLTTDNLKKHEHAPMPSPIEIFNQPLMDLKFDSVQPKRVNKRNNEVLLPRSSVA